MLLFAVGTQPRRSSPAHSEPLSYYDVLIIYPQRTLRTIVALVRLGVASTDNTAACDSWTASAATQTGMRNREQ